MKYTIQQLDQTRMSVKQFLAEEKEIPYWKILAGYHYITLSELKEKYYDCTVFFYNDPKDFGIEEDGSSMSFDRLFVEVEKWT